MMLPGSEESGYVGVRTYPDTSTPGICDAVKEINECDGAQYHRADVCTDSQYAPLPFYSLVEIPHSLDHNIFRQDLRNSFSAQVQYDDIFTQLQPVVSNELSCFLEIYFPAVLDQVSCKILFDGCI